MSPLTRRRFSLRWRQIGSDPHQSPFWIKALGLLPSGVGTRPLVCSTPENRQYPAKVQVVRGAWVRDGWARWAHTRPKARPAVPHPGCGFTDLWPLSLGEMANPKLARWQGRLGHRHRSVALWTGCVGGQSDLVVDGQPHGWLADASQNPVRRRLDSPRSRCRRAGCSNRPGRVCEQRS